MAFWLICIWPEEPPGVSFVPGAKLLGGAFKTWL